MKPTKLEKASELADSAVQEAQALGDQFVRYVDRDPDLEGEAEFELVSDLLVAFARHYFAGRALLAAVATELDAANWFVNEDGGWGRY